MFAHGISSFTCTWMNLGCQKRLQSTSAMTFHASCTHRHTSHDIEARDQIPHPLCMGIKFSTPGKVKAVKCQGYSRGGGGMLKRYISHGCLGRSHFRPVSFYGSLACCRKCSVSRSFTFLFEVASQFYNRRRCS